MTNVPTRDSTFIGALAARLRGAGHAYQAAQQEVTDLLERLFRDCGWRPRFPVSNGWRFDGVDKLDVFGVAPTAPAFAALGLAGFGAVILHDHEASVIECSCQPSGTPT